MSTFLVLAALVVSAVLVFRYLERESAIRDFHSRVAAARSKGLGRSLATRSHILDLVTHLLEPMHVYDRIEGAVCLYLDSASRLRDIDCWVGDSNSVPMPPQGIVDRALSITALGVAIGHNHPGSNTAPSDVDVRHAAGLTNALSTHGLRLIECYVSCGMQYKSVLNSRRYKDLTRTVF